MDFGVGIRPGNGYQNRVRHGYTSSVLWFKTKSRIKGWFLLTSFQKILS
jgi:hypothetical protein